MKNQLVSGTSACDRPECCGANRREFLQAVGIGAAAVLGARRGAMAGPFEAKDFDRLVPADKRLSADWVKSLFARGTPAVYRGEELRFIGMPVGGICAGQVYLGGDGRLWHWDIFNRQQGTGAEHYAQPMTPSSPFEQGFAIRVGDGNGNAGQTRLLNSTGFAGITFVGQYPIGTVQYKDAEFSVAIEMEAFSPFIPLNADDSGLPATVLQFTLTNTSSKAVEVTLAGSLQNAGLLENPQANATRKNRIVRGDGVTFLSCSVDQQEDPATTPAADVLFEDWNKDDYAGWTVEGTAFGKRPAKRSEAPAYMGELGGEGERLVNSHISAPGNSVEAKDGATGKLTSKPFTIGRDFINFWIGGGGHAGKTCINLLIDGKVVRTAGGTNNNRMALAEFSVKDLRGKQAALEIVDAVSGGWGNIGVGRILFSDKRLTAIPVAELADFGNMALALIGNQPEHALTIGGKDGGLATPPGGKIRGNDRSAEDAVSPLGEVLIGAIGRTLTLGPGEAKKVDFILAWHFPNLTIDGLGKVGRSYGAKFASASAVAKYVADNFDRLTLQTRLWRDTWYDSTLPHWFLDRTLQSISTLATGTCFRFADGRFYAWEGVACCPGTCTHVWHYAHAVGRLFPEIERSVRERVDLGIAFNADTGVMGFRAEFDRGLAVDGQAGTLLRCYREHQMSPDGAFLKHNWPKIKKAFEPLLNLDAKQDGMLGGGQMNTLDAAWFGENSWLSSLYLAALRGGAEMAADAGEPQFAQRCTALADKGGEKLTADLFNGEYFINKVDPKQSDSINSGTGCEIDQVFGQGWAFAVGVPRVLPEKQTRTALKSLWRYNFTPDAGAYRKIYKPGRWYAMAGEAGLLMCSFPKPDWDYDQAKGKGPDWAAGYFNECMNGFEHQVAGHMIWEGLVQEGLAVERALHDRYHPSRRNPWNEIECGDHYSRSMASFGVYLAACGFEYHGPRESIAFAPRLHGEDFKAAFTAAEGWGTFTQKITGGKTVVGIDMKYGALRIKTLKLGSVAGQAAPRVASVSLRGKPVGAKFDPASGILTLKAGVTIKPGELFEATLSVG